MSKSTDSRSWWRRRAMHLQYLLDKVHASRDQALEDYDQVESELRALLSPALTEDPNPSLLALTHEDLALLADQYRVRLLKGTQPMPLTNAQGLEEEPLPTTDLERE